MVANASHTDSIQHGCQHVQLRLGKFACPEGRCKESLGLTSVRTVDKFISKNNMQMIMNTQVTLQQGRKDICEF